MIQDIEEKINTLEKQLAQANRDVKVQRWDKGQGAEARYNLIYQKLFRLGARRNRLRKKYCVQ